MPIFGLIGSIFAGNAQASNDKKQRELEERMFNEIQANEAPYVAAGGNAINALETGLGIQPGGTGQGSLNAPFTQADFQSSPGYAFQTQQGQEAIINQASATGGIGGGNTLKALDTFGQGVANQDWWNAYNAYTQRQQNEIGTLGTIAQLGSNAGSNATTGASAFAGQIGQAQANIGTAQAQTIAGAAKAAPGVLNMLTSLLGGGGGGGSGGTGSLITALGF